MTTKTKCQAKNPATCPYHGQPQQTGNSLKDRIRSLTQGTPVHFSSYGEKAEKVTASITIAPRNKTAKAQPVYIDVEGDSLEDVQNVLNKTIDGINLKEYTTGYKAEILFPSSANKTAAPIKHTATTDRSEFLDDTSVDLVGIPGFKQAIKAEVAREVESNQVFDDTINKIKDSKIGQSVNGAKAIAVVEAMNEFKYFHLRKDSSPYEVEAAFSSLLRHTGEYTNRGWGIRCHFDYSNGGEVTKARFSLDNPDDTWNSFKQEHVDKVNKSLNEYLSSFNK